MTGNSVNTCQQDRNSVICYDGNRTETHGPHKKELPQSGIYYDIKQITFANICSIQYFPLRQPRYILSVFNYLSVRNP